MSEARSFATEIHSQPHSIVYWGHLARVDRLDLTARMRRGHRACRNAGSTARLTARASRPVGAARAVEC